MMLQCREAARQVSKGLDAPLPLKERLSLAFHLWLCPRCTEYQRQLLALRAMLGEELEKLLHPSGDSDDSLTAKEKEYLLQPLTRSGG